MKITMTTPEAIADHQLRCKEKQDILESVKHETFVEDFEHSLMCAKVVEAQVLYLKHDVIPTAVAIGAKQTSFTMDPSKYISPWINNDPTHQKLAFECIMRVIQKILGSKYTVEYTPTGVLKVSW